MAKVYGTPRGLFLKGLEGFKKVGMDCSRRVELRGVKRARLAELWR